MKEKTLQIRKLFNNKKKIKKMKLKKQIKKFKKNVNMMSLLKYLMEKDMIANTLKIFPHLNVS